MQRILAKLIALTLTTLMVLSAVPLYAIAESPDDSVFDHDEYASLAGELYGDLDEPYGDFNGFERDLTSKTISGLLQTAIGPLGGIGGTIFDAVFPGNDPKHAEIISHLHIIEGKLDSITNQLNAIKNLLVTQEYVRQIDAKLSMMMKANEVIKEAFTEYDDENSTLKDKAEALDLFFRYNPDGYDNAFFFFSYYCTLVSGTSEYGGLSTFELYDLIAEGKWNFDYESAAFRQIQRDMDIHFIARMASLLGLWLEKESVYGLYDDPQPALTSAPANDDGKKPTPEPTFHPSPYADKLERYRNMLIAGLQQVQGAYNERPVILDDDATRFNYKGSNYTASFIIYKGYAPGSTDKISISLKDPVFHPTLFKDRETYEVEDYTEKLVRQYIPSGNTPGRSYRLITKGELQQLANAAETRGLSVRALLEQGGGFPALGLDYALYAYKENQPLHFSSDTNTAGRRRNFYLENANISESTGDMWSDTHVGNCHLWITDTNRFDNTSTPFIDYTRYKVVVASDSPNMAHVDDTFYLPIWVADSKGVPEMPYELPPQEANPSLYGEAYVIINAVKGDIATITALYTDEDGNIFDPQPDDPEVGDMRIAPDAGFHLAASSARRSTFNTTSRPMRPTA